MQGKDKVSGVGLGQCFSFHHTQPGPADKQFIADLPPASNGPETISTIDLQTGCRLSPFLGDFREGHRDKNTDRQTPRADSDCG